MAMIFDAALGSGAGDNTPGILIETAKAADDLGFRALWASDHLLAPSTLPQFFTTWEPFVVLSHIAALTQRIRLGTSVIVAPMRSPFVMAKQAATLDQLCGGRLILGVGVGSFEAEYVSVHAEFRTRGARMDEMLRLFKHVWAGETGPFDGKFYGFPDGVTRPLPVKGADLPLLVGGRSDAALRRVAKYASFWQTTTAGTDIYPGIVAKLRDLPGGDKVEVGSVLAFKGDLAEARAAVTGWEAAGAQHLSVSFGPADGKIDRMRAFAQEFGLGRA